jgi:hypothetical protein
MTDECYRVNSLRATYHSRDEMDTLSSHGTASEVKVGTNRGTYRKVKDLDRSRNELVVTRVLGDAYLPRLSKRTVLERSEFYLENRPF